jgi:hypothetical protein
MSSRSIILTVALACFATACVDGAVDTAPQDPTTPETTSEPKSNFTCESLLDTTCKGSVGDKAVTAIMKGMGPLTDQEETALETALDKTELNKKDIDIDVNVEVIVNAFTLAILNHFTNNGNLHIENLVVCVNNHTGVGDQKCSAH